MTKVLRTWTFWIRTELEEECREYLHRFILGELQRQPGNLRATPLFRALGDGVTQVVVASIWESMAKVRDYDGGRNAPPLLPPEVQAKLLDRDSLVRHYAIDSIDDPMVARILGDGR